MNHEAASEQATALQIPEYRLSHFEGPLDLLLFLIRRNEVNIYDIPIAEITEQYLEFLKYSSGSNLDESSEFYLIAATLLHIKSRMLLPVEVNLEDEIEDPREELVGRLIEYERFKKLTDLLEEREAHTDWIVERNKTQAILPFPDEENLWTKVDSWDLVKNFARVMKNLGSEQFFKLWEEVSINEKITLVTEYLETRDEFNFDDLLLNRESLVEIVSTFLAVLELVKIRVIDVFQNRLFGDIKITASK